MNVEIRRTLKSAKQPANLYFTVKTAFQIMLSAYPLKSCRETNVQADSIDKLFFKTVFLLYRGKNARDDFGIPFVKYVVGQI